MPVQELERGHLSTSSQSAEIQPLQLFKEVHIAPDVGRNSHLEGTGFNLPLEMGRLVSNYNQNLKEGKRPLEALTLSVSELEVNIRTFVVEYIQTKTVLPHVNSIKDVDGVTRMVGQNGVPVISGITSAERYGSVLEASRKTEDFLTASGIRKTPNRVAVINSPLGHSGLISEKGEVINYKNNQTMVFWTDEKGDLYGVTLVSDLSKEQSRQLSISLGVDAELLSADKKEEEIANIVKNPVLFSYSESIKNPARYVCEKILAIRGSGAIRLEQEDGTVEYRSVAQTLQDIENLGTLLKFDSQWENCLNQLQEAILSKDGKLNNSVIQAEIAKKIEETILEITVDYLAKTQHPKFTVPQDNVVYFKPVFDSKYNNSGIRGILVNDNSRMDRFAVAAAFLRTRAGCAGGGGSVSALRGGSLGLSSGFFGASRENASGMCSECRRPNMDNHYHCPDCNKEYADETNTERTSVCKCGFKFGCGGSSGEEEKPEESSKIIAFPVTSNQSSAPAEMPKAA